METPTAQEMVAEWAQTGRAEPELSRQRSSFGESLEAMAPEPVEWAIGESGNAVRVVLANNDVLVVVGSQVPAAGGDGYGATSYEQIPLSPERVAISVTELREEQIQDSVLVRATRTRTWRVAFAAPNTATVAYVDFVAATHHGDGARQEEPRGDKLGRFLSERLGGAFLARGAHQRP